MKKTLLIILICLSFTCSANTRVVKNTTQPALTNNTLVRKQTDTTKTTLIIEEKAPKTILKEAPVQKKEVLEITAPIKRIDTVKSTPKISKEPKKVSKTLLHQPWNALLKKYVSKDGNINYKGFKQDRAFRLYLKTLSTNMPDQNWSKNEKLAYWLNVYNAFTIKLITNNYPLKSIKEIKKPWDLRFFKLGSKWYTLNDVEHRILRKMKDPRIHFGINCASFSCPPLLNKAFTSKNVNSELEKLAISFINDPKRNKITANTIELSKIFLWFAKDFKYNGTLVSFLNKYSKITINPNAQKSYMDYNWNLNE